MGYTKVQTDISKSYINANQALKDEGYTSVGIVDFKMVGKGSVSREVYEKDGNKYYFVGMNHFNTTINHITLRNIEELTNYTYYEH